MSEPYTADEGGVTLTVRITPKASRDALGAVIALPDGRRALGLRVAAPPVDGAANAALTAYLAKRLGAPKSAVTIRSGETGRLKIVRIAGDGAALAARLAALIADGV